MQIIPRLGGNYLFFGVAHAFNLLEWMAMLLNIKLFFIKVNSLRMSSPPLPLRWLHTTLLSLRGRSKKNYIPLHDVNISGTGAERVVN